MDLKFLPQASYVSVDFWQALSQRKIDVDKLRVHAIPITAAITFKSAQDDTPPRVDLNISSLNAPTGHLRIPGAILNVNTIDAFKAYDKNAFLRDTMQRIQDAIASKAVLQDPTILSAFAILCFADLKRYTYTYWTAFPALPSTWSATFDRVDVVAPSEAFFLYDTRDGSIHPMSAQLPAEYRVFGFVDTSSNATSLSWPARNYLYMIHQVFGLKKATLLAYRGQHANNPSLMVHCKLKESAEKPVGWERDRNGRLAPRVVSLASQLDPVTLANDAVNLNLKLMRWRAAPVLDLDRIRKTRCLLLGAGTLGCYTARLLMAWGVQRITLVDNGTVSYSNPVRQPLFRATDAAASKNKAVVAAEALKEVYPGVQATGIALNVPMLGHPLPTLPEARNTVQTEYDKLGTLFDEHDAIFLLMDSRESRWLPTVLGKEKDKIVLNAALGFDSYVVLRHGVKGNGLGCYFCNDVVAPSNSLMDRSLDQMCTVTRPGLAALASAHAVELLVSMLAHPDGHHAKADTSTAGPLGKVPHTIRGFLAGFNNLILRGDAFPQCSACSETVLSDYKADAWAFLQRALDDPGYIERLSGLADVKAAAAALDWDEASDFELSDGDQS